MPTDTTPGATDLATTDSSLATRAHAGAGPGATLGADPGADSRGASPRPDMPRRRVRRALLGLSVIGLGTLALLDNLHTFSLPLLRTFWPLVFVAWGLGRLGGSRHLGGRVFGLVLVAVGGLMVAHNLGHDTLDLRHWWPVFIILAGVAIVVKGLFPGSRSAGWSERRSRQRGRSSGYGPSTLSHADEVDVDTTFGGLQLQNDSRAFKGGRVDLSFGGLELDLRQATMAGPEATLLVKSTFSGIDLRVPRDWQVVVQVATTLGAVEDKTAPPPNPVNRLILRGEVVLGGLEVRN